VRVASILQGRLLESENASASASLLEVVIPFCLPCHRLTEKPTRLPPHKALRSDCVQKHPDGTLQRFQCAKCGRRWERLVPRPYFRDRPLFWRII
jgi:hypothetical protein